MGMHADSSLLIVNYLYCIAKSITHLYSYWYEPTNAINFNKKKEFFVKGSMGAGVLFRAFSILCFGLYVLFHRLDLLTC